MALIERNLPCRASESRSALPDGSISSRSASAANLRQASHARLYLANQACIELHAFLSRIGALDRPDQLVFDLDEPDEDHLGGARVVALRLRQLLEDELGRPPIGVSLTGAAPGLTGCAGSRRASTPA